MRLGAFGIFSSACTHVHAIEKNAKNGIFYYQGTQEVHMVGKHVGKILFLKMGLSTSKRLRTPIFMLQSALSAIWDILEN